MFKSLILIFAFSFTIVVAQEQEPVITPPEFGDYDPQRIEDIDLDDYPILPEVTDHARIIFERGLEAERNPAMFSKVGDSMTASDYFLTDFGTDDYDLGDFQELADLLDYIKENSTGSDDTTAFDRTNYATALGFSAVSALDPTWATAEVCEPNETPLQCEYRVSNSAFALIMLGTNDVLHFDEATYDYFLRLIIIETINSDVMPVLHTFPIRPEVPEKTVDFNRILVSIAEDYDIPLVNMAKALEDLPDRGIDLEDPLHLTVPDEGTVAMFNDTTLQAGYAMRNLVTLQVLDHLLDDLMDTYSS